MNNIDALANKCSLLGQNFNKNSFGIIIKTSENSIRFFHKMGNGYVDYTAVNFKVTNNFIIITFKDTKGYNNHVFISETPDRILKRSRIIGTKVGSFEDLPIIICEGLSSKYLVNKCGKTLKVNCFISGISSADKCVTGENLDKNKSNLYKVFSSINYIKELAVIDEDLHLISGDLSVVKW